MKPDAMQVEWVPIDSVHADPANVRRHPERNLASIKASLARFGQQKPVVVDGQGIVRAGNGTLEAARALGWKEIAIVRSGLKGTEATAYAIADNRTAELAEWDEPALAEQLRSLQSEDFELAATGFDGSEVDTMLGRLASDLTNDDVNEDSPKLAAFIEAREKSRARGDDKADCCFYVCLVFQSTGQKQEFLDQVSEVPTLYGMYVDGQTLAQRIGLPVTPNTERPHKSPLDDQLSSRSMATG